MKHAISVLLLMVGGLFVFLPVIVWSQRPELSQMELLYEVWYMYLIGFAALFVGYKLNIYKYDD